MRIKLDENLALSLKPVLQKVGHDVETAASEGLLHEPDEVIGAAASREKRMLFTLDVEFADLRKHPPGSHHGVVLLRPRGLGPHSTEAMILDFLRENRLEELVGFIVIVEPSRVRVRKPDIDLDSPEWRIVPIE